jgi:ATP-binding cassette subfamily B protein
VPENESFWRELPEIGDRARQLWGLIPARQRWTLKAAILLMALGGASNTAVPLLLGKLVDAVGPWAAHAGQVRPPVASGLMQTVGIYLALIGMAYALRELMQIGRRYLVEDSSTRLEKRLLVLLVTRLLMADLSRLSQEKVGALHGRILRNVQGSIRFLRVGFLDSLPALVLGTLALGIVTAKQPWLGLVMAGVIPTSLAVTVWQLVSQKGVRLNLLRSREEMDSTLVEQLQAIDYIRAANTYQREVARVEHATEHLRASELQHHFKMSLYGSSKAIVEGTSHICVLAAAVYMAATGRISVGDILTYSMLFFSVMAPLNEVHRIIDEGHESSLLVGEMLKMLHEPADRSFDTPAAREPSPARADLIQVENLCVTYESTGHGPKPGLHNVSLAIRRGEIIGIAGRSGCGKTTLLRTLLRLVHPSAGFAALDGVPLDALSRDAIARLVGYVAQSPFIFSGTIRENIAYERQDASDEEIHHAARLACLDEDIQKMPGGYQARVAERGKNLSGGQRQRLALARALVKNSPLLILDEATSALDTISERRIQQSLAELRGKQTVILVAHRLSTLLHTDRVIVFDAGQIAETGTYAELVDRGGVFTQLVNATAVRSVPSL